MNDYKNRIYHTDAESYFDGLPPNCLNMIGTSPPYWNQRDYGVPNQLGQEKTPELYVANLVNIFRAAKRPLRTDGTLWLNLGDTYASVKSRYSSRAQTLHNGKSRGEPGSGKKRDLYFQGFQDGDLLGIPWRVAFAMQADGWILRSCIIWHKPNPMPESVRNRPTVAHEYLFLFAQNNKPLFWTHRNQLYQEGYEKQRTKPEPDWRWIHKHTGEESLTEQTGKAWKRVNLWESNAYYYDAAAIAEKAVDGDSRSPNGSKGNKQPNAGRRGQRNPDKPPRTTRNRRSVWSASVGHFKGAHFATFPEKLIRPCILAGSPIRGVVCDPFFGAGTTGVVAQEEWRYYTGCDLNPDYIQLALDRIESRRDLFALR